MKKKTNLINIAIVPARIGSKRIKQKNIKKFFGKPIIYWTLKFLKNSKIFSKIFVSTDSKKIVNLAKKIGFNDFIIRGKKLSNDKTGTEQVIVDAINKISINYQLNNIFCVYPCTPFLQKKQLITALSLLKKNPHSFIFPVVKYSHPIERAFYFSDKNKKFIKKNVEENLNRRTQDFKDKFYDSGSFYLANKKTWLNKKKKIIIGINSPWFTGVDIDNLEDWKKAEVLFKFKKALSNY